MSWTVEPVGVWIDPSSSYWTVRICDHHIEDNVSDQPIIVASPSHFAVCMLVARMRAARGRFPSRRRIRCRERPVSGLDAWCKAHPVTLHWTEPPAGEHATGNIGLPTTATSATAPTRMPSMTPSTRKCAGGCCPDVAQKKKCLTRTLWRHGGLRAYTAVRHRCSELPVVPLWMESRARRVRALGFSRRTCYRTRLVAGTGHRLPRRGGWTFRI